jgi:hypothetical protein
MMRKLVAAALLGALAPLAAHAQGDALQVVDARGEVVGRYLVGTDWTFAHVVVNYNGAMLSGHVAGDPGQLNFVSQPLLSNTPDCAPPYFIEFLADGSTSPLPGTQAMALASRGGRQILAVSALPTTWVQVKGPFYVVSDKCKPLGQNGAPQSLGALKVGATYDVTGRWPAPFTLR